MIRIAVTLALAISIAAPAVRAEDAKKANRLAAESSPYLRLHADNPVDWYPWSDAAFEAAEAENKPVFLSIGYSTCHWCHVMERESFSNDEVAEVINEGFIAVKVDREERPDVDATYIEFLRATTGTAGWPATILLTPDGKPFFGGTYFPPFDRDGKTGLTTILQRISAQWKKDPSTVQQMAEQITAMIAASAASTLAPDAGYPADDAASDVASFLRSRFDHANGGFGRGPKFPEPPAHRFLLDHAARSGDADALAMVRRTLDALVAGGIRDHVGGGFHRYAVDPTWRVPHYEKMLYDQAQIALLLTDAFRVTGDREYAKAAKETLDYLLRDMQSPRGGFYSAEDAESLDAEGRRAEGAFYLWTHGELTNILGKNDAAMFAMRYGLDRSGRETRPLMISQTIAEIAASRNVAPAEVEKSIRRSLEKLLSARAKRSRPPLDDKILTSWNGLAISALAVAAEVFDEPAYRRAAVRAASFVRDELRDSKTDALFRRWRNGERGIDGFAEDYAFYIRGLLDLYETTYDVDWLELAVRLQEKQDSIFWNEERGRYEASAGTDRNLVLSVDAAIDDAMPSHHSVSAHNLLQLSQITDRAEWDERARTVFRSFARSLDDVPLMASAWETARRPKRQIIVAGKPSDAHARAILDLVHDRYQPGRILLMADGGEGQKKLAAWIEALEAMRPIRGKAAAYICENYVCQLPTSDLAEVVAQLDGKR